jgi:hypothetical protein
MIVRSASLLATALACLAAPAWAQDELGPPPPLPELVTADLPSPEDVTLAPEALPEPAAEGGWEGEWQGEWAPDGTYRGTWSGSYSDPGPIAARAIHAGSGTGYDAAERTAWLNQCRNLYYPGSAATGAVVAAQTDVCESYLQQYERNFALAAQGAAPAAGGYGALPAAPGAYAPGGYGSPYAPVMWVRVPIIRQPVEAGE